MQNVFVTQKDKEYYQEILNQLNSLKDIMAGLRLTMEEMKI